MIRRCVLLHGMKLIAATRELVYFVPMRVSRIIGPRIARSLTAARIFFTLSRSLPFKGIASPPTPRLPRAYLRGESERERERTRASEQASERERESERAIERESERERERERDASGPLVEVAWPITATADRKMGYLRTRRSGPSVTPNLIAH